MSNWPKHRRHYLEGKCDDNQFLQLVKVEPYYQIHYVSILFYTYNPNDPDEEPVHIHSNLVDGTCYFMASETGVEFTNIVENGVTFTANPNGTVQPADLTYSRIAFIGGFEQIGIQTLMVTPDLKFRITIDSYER